MQQIVEMLRERYILEFPRPSALKPGNQIMTVRIDGSDVLIHPAGDGVPVADQPIVADSTAGPGETPVATPSTETPAALPPAEQQPAVQGAAVQPSVQNPVAQESSAQPVATQHPEAVGTMAPEIAEPLFKVSTRLTVEDVTVSDRDRRPVHGLVQSNFSIEEDGQPQTIRNFEEYGAERPSEPATSPAQLPANVFTNAQPQVPTTSAVNVILLDDVSTGSAMRFARAAESQAYARQQSMKYLSKMPDGTQVAILQMGSDLQVVQGFTADKSVLLAAMKGASYKPTAAAYVESPDAPLAEWCKAANEQSELTLSGLKKVAGYLSGIMGKKNLIWFTSGIPWLTNYPKFSRALCLVDHTEDLHKALALLIAAEVPVYPVDPRGMFTDSASSAMSDSFASRTGLDLATQTAEFSADSSADHDSLQAIADATGGVPYFNRNDVDASVAEAIQTGADYYSLSYFPPLTKYDGKYHTIEVKLDRPGLHLQYRPGYTAVDVSEPAPPSADGPADSATENELFAAMGHGEAASTQLLFDVRVTPSTESTKPGDPEAIGSLNPTLKHLHLVRYDFRYSLAPAQISLLDAPDGRRKGSVKFAFTVYDGDGKMLNVIAETLKINLRPDEVAQFMQHPLLVPLQFDLPSGKSFVRLGVMDTASQKIGTLEIPETVAK
jgi:VWFA-related protein